MNIYYWIYIDYSILPSISHLSSLSTHISLQFISHKYFSMFSISLWTSLVLLFIFFACYASFASLVSWNCLPIWRLIVSIVNTVVVVVVSPCCPVVAANVVACFVLGNILRLALIKKHLRKLTFPPWIVVGIMWQEQEQEQEQEREREQEQERK